MTLPIDPNTTRKDYPLYSGLLSYFPDALAYVSYVSKKANDQHNPGEPLHWAREKSDDHLDCLGRHFLRAGEFDDDGLRESGKMAWRSLANLQIELEAAREETSVRVTKGVARYEEPKTLYDWVHAPAWANWAVADKYGAVWYEYQPIFDRVTKAWGCTHQPPGSVADIRALDWNGRTTGENSLEARPQRQEPSFAEMTAKLPVCFERGAV